MRLILDSLMAVVLAALLAGILLHQRHEQQRQSDLETVRANVRLIQQQIMLQSALERVPRNEYGFPITIDPQWFGDMVPRNPLLGPDHPWMEVAGADEARLTHPVVRTGDHPFTACFWYNPITGTVRARVPHTVSDRRTLELYNFVNGCNLPSLFASGEVMPGDGAMLLPRAPRKARAGLNAGVGLLASAAGR